MNHIEEKAFEVYPVIIKRGFQAEHDVNLLTRRGFIKGYKQAEKDLGWHLSIEHPPVDEEVIVLLGRYEDFPQIAFGHIVDQSIAIDFNGWNIPGVKYWMPMPKLPNEDE